MKRKIFLQYLSRLGCLLAREGANHTVYFHPVTRRTSTIPRHREVNDWLVRKICRDLGVKEPGKT